MLPFFARFKERNQRRIFATFVSRFPQDYACTATFILFNKVSFFMEHENLDLGMH